MFFWEDKRTNPPGAMLMRRQITEIELLLENHHLYLELDTLISTQLEIDLVKLKQ
jgi:hypothetical protein